MILIDPGNIDEKQVESLVSSSTIGIKLITQIEKSRKHYASMKLDCFSYKLAPTVDLCGRSDYDFTELYKKVMSDINTHHILDRRVLPRSMMQNSFYIMQLISTYAEFIISEKISRYILLSIPHSINSWVMAHCFEFITDSETEYFTENFLPWRAVHISGIDARRVSMLNQLHKQPIADILWDKFVAMKTGSGLSVMPTYERKLIKRSQFSKYLNFLKENILRPDILINTFLCKKFYKENCITKVPSKFVLLFLHFQPERTTSPAGEMFSNQLLVASVIMQSLPKNWKLIIKEHPSSFLRGCDWKHRWPGYYKQFVMLGASFVDVDSDTYDLMDRASCISSVGGTVISEAIFRNTPAVYFGIGCVYPLVSSVLHKFSSVKDLGKFFSSLDDRGIEEYRKTLERFRDFIDDQTISASLKQNEDFDELTTLKFRENSILEFIKLLV